MERRSNNVMFSEAIYKLTITKESFQRSSERVLRTSTGHPCANLICLVRQDSFVQITQKRPFPHNRPVQ